MTCLRRPGREVGRYNGLFATLEIHVQAVRVVCLSDWPLSSNELAQHELKQLAGMLELTGDHRVQPQVVYSTLISCRSSVVRTKYVQEALAP